MSQDPPSNRRDFLRGRSHAGVPTSDSDCVEGASERRGYLGQYTKPAMACQFEVLLNLRQYAQGPQAVSDAFELLDLLEDQLSVYRATSEVSQLNRSATQKAVAVETRLFLLLQKANELARDTGGAFDITSSPLTQLWGFDQRAGVLPDRDAIDSVLQQVGFNHLELQPDRESVAFAKDGIQVNLGGIGKGYAIDRMAELFREQGVGDYIIHGGQSSVLAQGRQDDFADPSPGQATQISGPANNSSTHGKPGWTVGLSHPTIPNVRLAEFTLRDQALGTSGTGRQGFFHQGKRYGHIIDPRTGWPTDHVFSSTVISSSAALSDALATAFFVMSLDEVDAYCQSHPDVSALLVLPNKGKERTKGGVSMKCFNLRDDQWKRLE